MMVVLDCDSAQTRPVLTALSAAGANACLASGVDAIEGASKIIIPPGSSYRRMLGSLRDRALVGPLIRAVEGGKPVLAIGNGLHLLFDVSYEDAQHMGLGIVHGRVARFDFGRHPVARHFSAPHQGWNQVHWALDCPLFNGLESGDYFYFDHWVHPEPLDRRSVAATTNHGIDFSSVIWQGNVFGTVFFPERSDAAGSAILRNFIRL